MQKRILGIGKSRNNYYYYYTDINVDELAFKTVYDTWISRIKLYSKPNTVMKYEGTYYNHLTYFDDCKVLEANSKKISEFTDKLLSEGLSNKTINDILIVLNMVLKSASIDNNIALPKIEYLREPKKEMRVLTIYEQRKLIQFLTEDITIHKFGVLLAMYTGLRLGELCALKWDDISDSSIYVNKTMMRVKSEDGKTEVVIAPPKSDSSVRIIPIPYEMKKYIARFRKDGFVLSDNRLEYTEPRLMQYKFNKYIKECKLENVSFHCLRHTFATRCIEAGVDAKTVSELLGHSDTKITLKHYIHSSFDLKQASIEKMEKLLK